jgi:hypothetical protein
MSRRRVQKQQEKEDFLNQNPELRVFETRIEVGRDDEEWDSDVFPYVIQATQNGEEVAAATYITDADHDQTLASFAATELGYLEGGVRLRPEVYGLRTQEPLSLTEEGIGVAQKDMYGVYSLHSPEGMHPGNNYALDGDEVMVFTLAQVNGDSATRGGTEFGIDYTVLNGNGTVEITLVDLDPDAPSVTTTPSASLVAGQQGSLETAMPEGTYEMGVISVTGSLEVAIVGIDITSNTDQFFTT